MAKAHPRLLPDRISSLLPLSPSASHTSNGLSPPSRTSFTTSKRCGFDRSELSEPIQLIRVPQRCQKPTGLSDHREVLEGQNVKISDLSPHPMPAADVAGLPMTTQQDRPHPSPSIPNEHASTYARTLSTVHDHGSRPVTGLLTDTIDARRRSHAAQPPTMVAGGGDELEGRPPYVHVCHNP